MLAGDDALADLVQVERGALAVGVVAQPLRGRQHQRLLERRLDERAVVALDRALLDLLEAGALEEEAAELLRRGSGLLQQGGAQALLDEAHMGKLGDGLWVEARL